MRYIISDTHFYHNNIIKYCNRPFSSVEEMNDTLIENWNSIVKPEDTVFHLGDFAFKKNVNNIIHIVDRLNGKIVLIKGNHDHYKTKKAHFIFWEYYKYPVIIDDFIILSHQPVFLTDNSPYYNIHGHLHNSGHRDESNIGIRHTNVSVEVINYTPIDLDQLIQKIKEKEK